MTSVGGTLVEFFLLVSELYWLWSPKTHKENQIILFVTSLHVTNKKSHQIFFLLLETDLL